MKEPQIPPYTCPMIDTVVENIKAAEFSLNGLVAEMEDIRSANSQLRDCVEYWKDKAENLEKDVEKLEEQIFDLKIDLKDAAAELKEYKNES